jgi:hypothetical protein
MELIWPLFALVGLFFKVSYDTFLGWWLDPWLQRKANRALWEDVQTSLYFMTEHGKLIKDKSTQILPFDYASVRVAYENLIFIFTRGRDELNISLASRHAPDETFRFSVVVAALDSTGVEEQRTPHSLSALASSLRSRLGALNDAFSDRNYPEFRKKLSHAKDEVRAAIKTAEWELNGKLGHIR